MARTAARRRLRVTASVSAVSLLLLIGVAVTKSSLLNVESVVVTGAAEVDSDSVRVASGIELGQALIDVDPEVVAANVSLVPWIADARVDRQLFSTVQIDVTEHVGVLALPTESRQVLVSATGWQLEIIQRQPTGMLPVFGVRESGVPGQEVSEPGRAALALAQAIHPPVRDGIEAIRYEGGELFVDLAVGGQARIGNTDQLEQKLSALNTVINRINVECIDTVDVRVPNAPTVSRMTGFNPNEEPGVDRERC